MIRNALAWNAPALSDSHGQPRNVSFYRFGLQASEGVCQLPLWNRIPFHLSLIIWSKDLPEVLRVELYVEGGHRVAWNRLPLNLADPILQASSLFGETKWSDLAIMHHAIAMSRRGPPYQGVSWHLVSVEYQTVVEELAVQITTTKASEAPSQIPFDTLVTDPLSADRRWMLGIPPFAIPHHGSGTDWMGGWLFSVPAGPDGSTRNFPFHGERRIAYPGLRGPGSDFELPFDVDNMPNSLKKLVIAPMDPPPTSGASPEDFRPPAYAYTCEASRDYDGHTCHHS
ncbi:hypothetical protein C8J57DRAFT_1462613, partial [Mycena rebaudengoi]